MGNVVQVSEVAAGSELVGDVALGSTTLTVADTTDFTGDGGTILIADSEAVDYTTIDETTMIVTLATPTVLAHFDGDPVMIEPASVDRLAQVLMEGQAEAVEARIPAALYSLLPVGLRDDSSGETELVELGVDTTDQVIVTDVVHDSAVQTTPSGPTDDLADLRNYLYQAAGAPQIIVARNFDPSLPTIDFLTGGYATGLTRMYACYWPGGVCTGMYYKVREQGVYAGTGRSGTALYSTLDGLTLTREAALQAAIIEPVGLQKRVWTAPSGVLPAGIVYVAFRVSFTGSPTFPYWGALDTGLVDANGGDADNAATPMNWPLSFADTDDSGVLPASYAISAMTQGTLTLGWVGLF